MFEHIQQSAHKPQKRLVFVNIALKPAHYCPFREAFVTMPHIELCEIFAFRALVVAAHKPLDCPLAVYLPAARYACALIPADFRLE